MGMAMTDNPQATLLLVDDKPDNLYSLGQVISEYLPQCRLLSASNAVQGLKLADSQPLDGVLVDLQMPGMNGIEMCRQLKAQAHTARVPVILITSHSSSPRLRAEGLDAGAEDFIARPIDNLELVARIRTTLRMKNAEDRLLQANAELEQRVAQQTASLRDYQKAVESTRDLVATIDLQYRYLVVNEAYLHYFALERHEVLGRNLTEILGREYFELEVKPKIDRCLAGERNNYELSQTFPHLGLRHMLKDYAPLLDAAGQVGGVVCVMRDITARKRAEEELQESRQKHKQLSIEFQTLLNGIPDLLLLLTPQKQVVWANRAAEQYLLSAGSDLVGEVCSQLWQCERFPCLQCPVEQAFAAGRSQETLKRSADGRYWGIKAFPLNGQAGVENVILLAADISEKIRLREESLRSSRLASLGELAAGVAHEINNPNGLVMLNAPLLLDIWPDLRAVLDKHYREQGDFLLGRMNYERLRTEIPRMLSDICDGGKRIKNIVDDLKDFIREEDPESFGTLDINQVAQAAVRLVNNQLSKATHDFSVCYAADLPQINGSFQRLEQVLVNLLINACQALPDPNCAISLCSRFNPETAMVLLEVQDEGRGISDDHLPHITDPFFTTRREEGGTGLGLSVSARILKEHGGRMEFSSTQGKGTSITLSLPVSQKVDRR